MHISARRIVIGIGNADRGDDAAGRWAVRLMRPMLRENFEAAEHDGEALKLLSAFDGVAAAFLVDACQSGAPPGTVHRFDVSTASLPRSLFSLFSLSTHGLGLGEAIELGRALGRLPPCCIVYAIEGQSFEVGAPLSPPVSAAVADVAQRLASEISGKVTEGVRDKA
jgi:hydrogenase maturation protease